MVYARANGGRYWHLVPTDNGEDDGYVLVRAQALCRYSPSSKRTRFMRNRSGWVDLRVEPPTTDKCEKCMIKYVRAKQAGKKEGKE